MTRANMQDVAQAAGVATSTVCKVLNNRMSGTRVSASTRQRILDAVKSLNYVPNINAKRIFSEQVGAIGLIMPYLENPNHTVFHDQHLALILNGIERNIAACGYHVTLMYQTDDFIENRMHTAVFRGRQVDGVFVWGARRSHSFYGELAEGGYPHVFLSSRPDCLGDDALFFRVDYNAAGYTVMKHLLDKGHRRIAWCGERAADHSLPGELDAGIARALEEAGLAWDEVIHPVDCRYFYMHGVQAAERILREKIPVTAVCLVNHDAAVGCLDYFIKRGVRVPDDFALACCDSLPEEQTVTRITRSTADDVRLGRMAAERLLAAIERRVPAQEPERVMPPVFVPGETT